MVLLFAVFLTLMFMGVPISFSMLGSSVAYLLITGFPLEVAVQSIASAIGESFVLIAVPFYMLAGVIMNQGGITTRIFNFAKEAVGWIPGGLGHVNILNSVIFSGMSGTAAADTGGIGAMEIVAMRNAGFDEEFSVGVTAGSSLIGPIIPPSVPGVLLAVSGGISVGKLFIGGIVPGLVMALAMAIYVFIVAKKRKYPVTEFPTLKSLLLSFKEAFFALLSPFIIIGGIMAGVFTPTEASVVSVVYSIILVLAWKGITVKDIPKLILEAAKASISTMFIIASAMIFAWILTVENLPDILQNLFLSNISSSFMALMMIILLLLFVGTFMDSAAAITLLTPILMPIVRTYNIDPVHFGIIAILTLMIGLLTPPVGLNLFILTSVSELNYQQVVKACIPYVFILLVVVIIITLFPQIVLWLPGLL
ncbi:MAG: TRAP transporter large permease [Christensenellales bacterium]|mgnify:CR=1 FL=1|jgi:tripartite ATP-independent transporter DctM subunit